MKRALFVGEYPNKVEPYLRSFFAGLIHAIADLGIECTVIAPISVTHYKNNTTKIEEFEVDSTANGSEIKVYHPRYLSYSAKKIGRLNTGYLSEKSFQRAAKKCAVSLQNHFDFVYGHFFLTGGLAAIKIGNILNIPSFVAFGECDYESQVRDIYGDLGEKDINGIAGIVSVSSKNRKRLEEISFLKNIPILVAPNGVDREKFYVRNQEECRNILGLPLDRFIVGFVGGFIERKGDKRLLEAVNDLDDNVLVAFAGKGDNPPTGGKVCFCSALDHSMVPIFLGALDVFCLPTLSEGSCNAVVEALACGVPVISSDLEFNDDVLSDVNSVRINPNSIDEIRDAIHHVLTDNDYKARLHNAAVETAYSLNITERAKRILDFIFAHNKEGDCESGLGITKTE